MSFAAQSSMNGDPAPDVERLGADPPTQAEGFIVAASADMGIKRSGSGSFFDNNAFANFGGVRAAIDVRMIGDGDLSVMSSGMVEDKSLKRFAIVAVHASNYGQVTGSLKVNASGTVNGGGQWRHLQARRL
ncbi:hypothetical protein [Novosphingobium sp. 9U]|uniref:hypothetical protein n=1 Tax=Novosphingobium sp. 9U TaxID=2653158 RepID=UPI0012EFD088|nr:hypothetical protein [Novosphingobium sp. 9U]VWX47155.1 hypothetical protein NOVOSPHI9U_10541 [Novosphingobium sp. 9U]